MTNSKTPNTQSESKPGLFARLFRLLFGWLAIFRRNQLGNDRTSAAPFGQRLSNGIAKSRGWLGDGLRDLIGSSKQIDSALLDDIETQLLTADVGIEATQTVISGLKARLSRKELRDESSIWQALRAELLQIIEPSEQPLVIPESSGPFVMLVVGVNGAGKTTTIGKLALRYKQAGHSVVLAAGDTFRAAAVEQLNTWGARHDIPVISQATGADSASVIFDALESARSRKVDIVIADTAGRLHNADNLMNELAKVRRVIGKFDNTAPHETLLVLDGTTGQNAVQQAAQFTETAGVTGIAVTKLDGTAKGGVLFAVSRKLGLPIRYIGVGEAAEDLGVFAAKPFVDALLGQPEPKATGDDIDQTEGKQAAA